MLLRPNIVSGGIGIVLIHGIIRQESADVSTENNSRFGIYIGAASTDVCVDAIFMVPNGAAVTVSLLLFPLTTQILYA